MTSYNAGHSGLRASPIGTISWNIPLCSLETEHGSVTQVGPFFQGRRKGHLCIQVPAGLVHPEEFKVPARLEGMLLRLLFTGQSFGKHGAPVSSRLGPMGGPRSVITVCA